MSAKRVVVTGMGMVSPLGVGIQTSWRNLIGSKSGLVSTSTLSNAADYEGIPNRVVGKVPTGDGPGLWNPTNFLESHEVRRLSPFIQYAIAASQEALEDANWFPKSDDDQYNTGVAFGSGIGGVDEFYENSIAFHNKGYRGVKPLFIPKLLVNMAGGNVSIRHGFKGPNHAVSTACATGAHAIGDAARFIKDGYANVMVAGATEAAIHPVSLSGFARAKSLVTSFNDEPERASRPFDAQRNGFILGEGAGCLILEEMNHALSRGAKIYAEVGGYGIVGDAIHITSPDPAGTGATRAMEFAIKQAGLTAEDIDYVNAHATSTVLGDRSENFALKALFGHRGTDVGVSSTKGSIGHLLGGAGAVESIFTILALTNNIMPPTLNLESIGGHPDDNPEDFVFDYVPNVAREKSIRAAISNSFGFGGTMGSLCFKTFEK
ncbi:unnamed protein product [Kuraishia capsulata CBS 1993]|uniref:3-oxoacyl-[acyl-carrier-protein] synthase n=1 Tax=Kuraishia capsulata CBS 1993 TaxID=1382522 RepID=W6MIS2_9ASCO|nr:uncharacterized protein KUCA_T00002366001 [Kuraishia capsulata CBS 1993]CDK26394.1 unnamed protein product [Kuraishia capsulata CBS 1993]